MRLRRFLRPWNAAPRAKRDQVRRTVRPTALAGALMCVALVLVGLLGGDDAKPQRGESYALAMAPALDVPDPGDISDDLDGFGNGWIDASNEACNELTDQDRYDDHLQSKADNYCSQWYDEAGDGPPNLLTQPDKWVLWHMNKAAEETFGWWISAPDPIIGSDALPASATAGGDEESDAAVANADANSRPVEFGQGALMIIVITFAAGGIIISLVLVARSGDPQPARRAARGPIYAVVTLALVVPFINANVKASDAFARWIITSGLSPVDGSNGDPLTPALSLQVTIRAFLTTFDDENFILKFVFLGSLIIATLVLYLECIFRLFIVVAAAATMPVMASLSGTNHGKEFLKRTVAIVIPLCWLDSIQALGMVFPLQILDAHRDSGSSSTQSAFICLFGIIMVCFMPGALIRITMPIASEVANSGAMNRRLADAIPANGARVVAGAVTAAGIRRR